MHRQPADKADKQSRQAAKPDHGITETENAVMHGTAPVNILFRNVIHWFSDDGPFPPRRIKRMVHAEVFRAVVIKHSDLRLPDFADIIGKAVNASGKGR